MVRQKLADDAVIHVAEAQYIPPYKIHLWFSDGAEQIADFEKFLKRSHHPEIRKYMNKRLFRQFSIAHGRLDRNDYDLCFPMQDLSVNLPCFRFLLQPNLFGSSLTDALTKGRHAVIFIA